MDSIKNKFKKAIPRCIDFALRNYLLRKLTADIAENYLYSNLIENGNLYTKSIRYERYRILTNLISSVEKALTNENISPGIRKEILEVFIGKVMLQNKNENSKEFVKKYGCEPPGFISISPCNNCNLQCHECYALRSGKEYEELDFDIVDRIISEKTKLWNSYFTVISGGEPFMWRSGGKSIIDLCGNHRDNYFMIFTNGTLIDEDMAKQIADVGNITAAVSLEGFEEDTDERRGKGVYRKILKAMNNLRNAGVPFGVTITATRKNAERILSDEFIDFLFVDQGAVYGWILQYMPIGPNKDLNLMVTPEQRKWMFERENHFLHDKHIFLPDFWNGGVYSSGCLAGGRPGGYINIDWSGNVTPCVFYPYSNVNIKDIYSNNGNINDALKSELMVGIRKWQRDYGYEKTGKNVGNLIAPCGLRDHYEFTSALLEKTKSKPVDEDAKKILNDRHYYDVLLEYDHQFISLTEDIWQNEYISEDEELPIIIEM